MCECLTGDQVRLGRANGGRVFVVAKSGGGGDLESEKVKESRLKERGVSEVLSMATVHKDEQS